MAKSMKLLIWTSFNGSIRQIGVVSTRSCSNFWMFMRDSRKSFKLRRMVMLTLCALALVSADAFAADKERSEKQSIERMDAPWQRSEDPTEEKSPEHPVAPWERSKKTSPAAEEKPAEQSAASSGIFDDTPPADEERSRKKSRKKSKKRSVEKSEDDSAAEPSAERSSEKSAEPAAEESVMKPTDETEAGAVSSSSAPPLQGQTEVTELLLDEVPLYKQAMKSIDQVDYGRAVYYLKELNSQLGEGYEPYLAECTYLEAGCHQMLNRMNAAIDMYRKAFELFEKFDAQNPLKNKAWNQYSELKRIKLQAGIGQSTLQAGIARNELMAGIQQKHVALVPQKAKFAIDPNALLVVRDNNRDVLLEVNDRTVLPRIVKECFSEMSCLETAEIGSNVTNAEDRWFPLLVHGKSAAFAMNGSGHPTFRANVNGRSYLFDVILPDLAPGLRKVLLVTNLEKICAVDVDSFDTWLLRMQRANDGRVTTARWYKLLHKKDHAPFVSPIAKPNDIKNPASIRRW